MQGTIFGLRLNRLLLAAANTACGRLRVLPTLTAGLMVGLISGCASKPATDRSRIQLPGVRHDGLVTLPNQWSLRPVGSQVTLGDFQVNIAVHPKEPYAAILHAGNGTHEIIVVRLDESAEKTAICSRTTLESAFYGLVFSPDGRRIYASGGTRERIEQFDFNDGLLSNQKRIPVTTSPDEACVPAGLAVSADGSTLLVTCNRGHRLLSLDVSGPHRPLAVALSPESYPYSAVIDEVHGRVYVSLWGQAAVAVLPWPFDGSKGVVARWGVQDHPNEMILTRDGSTLYVANANRNTISVLDTSSGKTLEVLCSALFPNAPDGSTPNAIALSPDEGTMYVANATNNNLAVVDVSRRGKSRSLGFVPVGWYPTSVRFTPDGTRLLVANAKGGTPKANRGGPNPMKKASNLDEYIAGLFRGTLSIIDVPGDEETRRPLTAAAYSCSPLRADQAPVLTPPEGNPIPASVGEPSPIRYCIYVIEVSYRSYGEFIDREKEGDLRAAVAGLEQHFDPEYEPYNLEHSDVQRAERFIAELKRFESTGDMPRLRIVALPNDHTYGTRVGKLTPISMVAQNDLALGMVIEAVSHSRFWPETAVFIVEDDAQNGADHVDAHRTTAFVVSPFARRGAVDSTLYSTTSLLRSIELILGLRPMSQFDAAARPMYASFQSKRDLRPYQLRPAEVRLDDRNKETAWGADLSASLDLSEEDRADDLVFNEIIWRSVRGADDPMPAPVRAAFVFDKDEPDLDDD